MGCLVWGSAGGLQPPRGVRGGCAEWGDWQLQSKAASWLCCISPPILIIWALPPQRWGAALWGGGAPVLVGTEPPTLGSLLPALCSHRQHGAHSGAAGRIFVPLPCSGAPRPLNGLQDCWGRLGTAVCCGTSAYGPDNIARLGGGWSFGRRKPLQVTAAVL